MVVGIVIPSRVCRGKQPCCLSLGAVLEAVGLIALVSLLPISDELKWRILLGLGIGFIAVGYFFVRNRSNPKNKQSPPPTITPITHLGDSCNRSDSIGRKFGHMPNIPRRALSVAIAQSHTRYQPLSC